MRVGLFTREFPPQVYGGAGVHVDYLSRELAREIEVEVHCWGPQQSDTGNLHVRGAEPWAEISNGTEAKFKGALEAFSLNLTQVKALEGVDIVHTHTWYVSMAGYLAKKLYGMPFVLTTHSLEPLRAWKKWPPSLLKQLRALAGRSQAARLAAAQSAPRAARIFSRDWPALQSRIQNRATPRAETVSARQKA